MSTHTLQPLIWLARKWTSLRVTDGRPRSDDLFSARSAFSASGRTKRGFLIRACMLALLLGFRLSAPSFVSHRPAPVRHIHDGSRRGNVTDG